MHDIKERALRAGRTRTFLDTVAEMGATNVGAKIITDYSKHRESWTIDTADARGRLTQTLGLLMDGGAEVEWWAYSVAADGETVYYDQQIDWTDWENPVYGRFWAFQITEGGNIAEVTA